MPNGTYTHAFSIGLIKNDVNPEIQLLNDIKQGKRYDSYVNSRSFKRLRALERDVFKNKNQLNSLGGKLIFAGPHKDDNNKMMVLVEFDSPDL